MQPKPHLAYVCGNPAYAADSPSGYGTRMRELCRAFEEIGIRTSIHLPGRGGELVARANSRRHALLKRMTPKVAWEALKDVDRLLSDFRFDRRLAASLAGAPPDIIYECLELQGSVTKHLRAHGSGKFVLEIHGPLEEDARLTAGSRPLRNLLSRRVRDTLGMADHVVTVSSVVREWLVDQGVEDRRIVVFPNGVDLKEFDPERFRGGRSEGDETVVGFVGSDLAWHRLDSLLEAFTGLPPESKSRLRIVGSAAENGALRDMVRKTDSESRVSFVGSLPYGKIPEVIAGFDICVMPGSNRYGSPIKLFEYGAMGKAVIAPDSPPIREVFTDGVEAILVPSGDVGRIRNAMMRLIRDPVLRREMGAAIRRKVRSRYGWEHVARAIAGRILPGEST
jgi:glycosyltransferase involved in cell wall biosynthesis